MRRVLVVAAAVALACSAYAVGSTQRDQPARAAQADAPGLWQVYQDVFKKARYINLTHTVAPTSPVWKGFGPSDFNPTINPDTKEPYTYAKDGFEATQYTLATDQLGTQLDPPAHWDPNYP